MKAGIGSCNEKDAFYSGKKIAEDAMERGNIGKPGLVFAFCHGKLDSNEFFRGLQAIVGKDIPVVGGSAIGIITNDYLSYEGYPAGAAIIESDTIQCWVAAEGNLDKGERLCGRRFAEHFSDEKTARLLLMFYDSIKTCATADSPPVLNASSPLIEGIEQGLQSDVPIIGAGVMGDYDFGPARQFCGSYVGTQSVVGVMLSGNFKPYYRIMHGCTPLDGVYHIITKMEGSVIYELDGRPIVGMIDELYGDKNWRDQKPVSLLTIGINYGEKFKEPQEGNYVNRLITGALPGGEGISIFEPDLEPGTEIHFMLRDSEKMIESAKKNSEALMRQITADGRSPSLGMYIDCAGRAANYLNITTEEANEVQKALNQYNTPLLGFYSGVEVAPLLEKSRGLDWTGVLLVLAEEQEYD